MVGAWCDVISAFSTGRSAIKSAERAREFSRSRWKLRKVSTELDKSTRRLRRTWFSTLRCTINSDTTVSPAEVSSIAIRNLVLSRMVDLLDSRFLLYRTNYSRCHGRYGNERDRRGPAPASAASAGCACPRCAWWDSYCIPILRSATRHAKPPALHYSGKSAAP